MVSEQLRFEAWMGASVEFLIPDFASAAAALKTEMCLLKGRDYTKMLLENSGLKGIPRSTQRFLNVCNFATRSGKTIKTQCDKPSFNCALRGGR